MGIIVRQSFWILLVQVIGVLLGYFNLVWLFPKFLEVKEIGLLRTLFAASSLLAAFIPLGAHNAIIRFYPFYKDEGRKEDLVAIVLLIPLLGYAIFTLLLIGFDHKIMDWFHERSPLFNHYFYALLPFVFFLTYFRVFSSISRALLEATKPSVLREILFRVGTTFVVLLYIAGMVNQGNMVALYSSLFLIPVLILAIPLFYSKKVIPDPRRRISFTWKELRSLMAYGSSTVLTNAGAVLIKNVDLIMVTAMLGLDSAGIYSIAFYIALVSELPRRGITQISTPVLARAMKKNNMEEVKDLYNKTSIHYTLLGGSIFILIWTNIDNLFALMPNGDRFVEGKWVILAICFGKLTDMIAGNNGRIIMNSKKYIVNLYLTVTLGILVIILNYLLIPLYGILGAALASAVSLFIYNILKTIYVYYTFSIHPFSFRLLKLLFTLGSAYGIGILLPSFDVLLLDITLRVLTIALTVFLLTKLLKISDEIERIINKASHWRPF